MPHVTDTVFRYAAILAAICSLLVADAALTAHTWWLRLRGIHEETRMSMRLQRAVDWADHDPYLPDRWRDPRDIADDLSRGTN